MLPPWCHMPFFINAGLLRCLCQDLLTAGGWLTLSLPPGWSSPGLARTQNLYMGIPKTSSESKSYTSDAWVTFLDHLRCVTAHINASQPIFLCVQPWWGLRPGPQPNPSPKAEGGGGRRFGQFFPKTSSPGCSPHGGGWGGTITKQKPGLWPMQIQGGWMGRKR